MIRTMTLAREYGSGGAKIAERVARRLGWELIDRSLIEQISEKFHLNPNAAQRLNERGSWWLERIARAVWLDTGGTTVDVVDAENIHQFSRNAILEASYRGKCVIVGRGGAVRAAKPARRDAYFCFCAAGVPDGTAASAIWE
jgi:hypothetical protein